MDSTPSTNPHVDWREQARKLKEKGVRVYAVQALDRDFATSFYKELAQLTMGFHLKLHQFSYITDFLTAVCYREADDNDHNDDDDHSESGNNRLIEFESEVLTSGRMVRNLRELFQRLKNPGGPDNSGINPRADGLVPVSPSRFQVLIVDADKPIKVFAEERGLVFKVL